MYSSRMLTYCETIPYICFAQSAFLFVYVQRRTIVAFALGGLCQIAQIVLFVLVAPVWLNNNPDMVGLILVVCGTVCYLSMLFHAPLTIHEAYTVINVDDEHEVEECPICFQSMQSGVRMRCNHTFHKECIEEWLTINASCPMCRDAIAITPI